MKSPRTRPASSADAGFTLVEALAAVAFLAILVPVAMNGMRVASLAGVIAERKLEATRIGDQMLQTLVATGQWQQSATTGTITQDDRDFRWQLRTGTWNKEALRLLTLTVSYAVQGRTYEVQLSTLADSSTTTATSTTTR